MKPMVNELPYNRAPQPADFIGRQVYPYRLFYFPLITNEIRTIFYTNFYKNFTKIRTFENGEILKTP